MRMLGTICARGGSKGVPGKNVRPMNGKPLIAHTIEIALKWGRLDDLIVSTDSPEIAEVAREYGANVPFMRPPELATDSAGKFAVWKHALKFMEEKEKEHYDILFDMDPTSPLRIMEDLDKALEIFLNNQVTNVYSVCEARKNPYFNMVELDEKSRAHLCKTLGENTFLSRQKSPNVFEINGSIYIYRSDYIRNSDSVYTDNTMVYVMPGERSVDIDSPIDFDFVEFLMKKGIENGLYR